jgi:hypothetical protein
MKKALQIVLSWIVVLSLSVSCQNKKQDIIDLSTQEKYEQFLTDFGVKIPDNANFEQLKKTNDGNYKIFYSLPPAENLQDSLQKVYENDLDNLLLSKGWTKPEKGWNPRGTVYEKDNLYFKFFITVSEKHNIYELAFKYGQ